MIRTVLFRFAICFLMMLPVQLIAAVLEGVVTDEEGEPVPFVTVYVEGTSIGTTTNTDGRYRLELKDGFHTVVFRYVGFRTEIRPVDVSERTDLDVTLKRVVFQLGEAQVDGNEDPAYRIMRLARSRRKFYRQQVRDFSCKVYVKGVNYVKELPESILGQSIDVSGLDENRSGIIYLSESLSEYHYQWPDRSKERVIASKVSGNSQGFTWNNATSLNFNFYDRSFNLSGLSDRDLVSPLSPTANLYYRYVYRGFYTEDSIIVNRIELIPKVEGVPLFKGYLFIQENTWRIHGADLFMTSESGIEFVDTVKMKVDFIPLAKDLWMKGNLSFDFVFNVKLFKVKGWGSFTSVFSDYNVRSYVRDTTLIDRYAEVEEESEDLKDEVLEPEEKMKAAAGDTSATRFDFGNWKSGPLIKVESEANEKDTAFWENIRSIPLTAMEKRDYTIKDSIEVVRESKSYKDSIDRKNNRFALRDLLYGYTYRNSMKNYSIDVGSPLTSVQYNTVEGYLIDHTIGFNRTWRDRGAYFSLDWTNRYGFYSGRYYTKLRGFYRFNRSDRMSIRATAGHYVEQFNDGAVSELLNSVYATLLEENYLKLFEHTFGRLAWSMEVTNGLLVSTDVYLGQRRRLRNADNLDGSFVNYEKKYFSLNEPGNEALEVGDPAFNDNFSWIWSIGLRYLPGQKYMERPNGKISLGTKWPVFRLDYTRGIGGFGNLSANFDLIEFSVSDDHNLGMAGKLEWQAQGGWFLSASEVPFADRKHFNTTRLHVMRGGSGRFMALPYYSASTDAYFAQAHVEHHFHGFILNKVPLIKKLKWQVVGGFHYLYEPGYGHYYEATVGIENIFRILRADFVAPFRGQRGQPFTFRVQIGI